MRTLRALGALLGAGVVAAADIPFSLCGDDTLGVQALRTSEYPIKAGSTLQLEVVLTPTVEVVSGSLEMTLSIRGIQLYSGSVDVCKEAGVSCPLAAGKQVTISTKHAIPKQAPNARVDVHVVAVDNGGKQLSCLDAEIEIERYFTTEELDSTPAISGALIADVLMQGPSWVPHWSPRFANATLRQAVGMCGTILRGSPGYMELPVLEDEELLGLYDGEIPESFDAREKWPDCKGLIGHVRDQSSCGSCWAFSTTEALNDRLCIAKGVKEMLSPADTAACCHLGGSMGCNGGQPAGAWTWFTEQGVVSGGDNNEVGKGRSCFPYPFPSCAHHVDPTPEHPACPAEDFDTPRCQRACPESSYETVYREDKHMATKAYSVRGVASIQREIMTRGPVSAALQVYSDFLVYQSGVYKHVSGSPLGGHAVKVIGWGVEDGTPYWEIVNSWNEGWGEAGHVRILRGANECGIESEITAGAV